MKRGMAVAWLLLLLACGGPPGTSPSPGTTPTVAAPTPRPPDRPLETPPPVTNVPQGILDAILDQAAVLTGYPLDESAIVRAEPQVWSDGSLGCPQPGEMYTQALVEGYWVVVEADGIEYDFRVGDTGNFKLCRPS